VAKGAYFFAALLGLFLWFCAAHALAADAAEVEQARRTQLVEVATSQVGVREQGYNNGPEVRAYLASCGLKPPQFWCAAFIRWCYRQLGLPGPADAGAARNWFPPAKVIYRRGSRPRHPPRPGDLAGYYYRNLGRIGHIGMITRWDEAAGVALTIEGNYGGGSERNGDGVHRVRRLLGQVYVVSDWVSRP
jgi:hypothetical protein